MDLPISEKYVAIMSSSRLECCDACHDDGAFFQRSLSLRTFIQCEGYNENGEIWILNADSISYYKKERLYPLKGLQFLREENVSLRERKFERIFCRGDSILVCGLSVYKDILKVLGFYRIFSCDDV